MKTLIDYPLGNRNVAFFLEDFSHLKTYHTSGAFGYYCLDIVFTNGQQVTVDSDPRDEGITEKFQTFMEWYREVTTEE